ncbi:baseplate assembly protein [Desulfoluna butyratoxydans]|uniref:Baseplate protein j-like n=1 Tax=Desulfoluna butyratoxydans TaxID=231438 RepID=A0A4U8YL31_9BACT|nr:baseplate J/gp47 family protein [Desulfoluna butyratoxydans]VFQ44381.1 baseplate protein j-like [Desulfoluna butyratoxydans]
MKVIDLSSLAPPDVIEPLSFDDVLTQIRSNYITACTNAGRGDLVAAIDYPAEPAAILCEVAAYREMVLRARINDAARARMLAYATGADLDHIGAGEGVERLTLSPADETAIPPVPAVMEQDDPYRYRIQLARQAITTAGPTGSYVYHARSADARVRDVSVDAPAFARRELTPEQRTAAGLPADSIVLDVVRDAGLSNPMPGDVAVTVLSIEEGGVASQDLIDHVSDALSADDIRPLTDRPRVRAASILHYTIEATLTLKPGPDPEPVRQAAIAAAWAMAEQYSELEEVLPLSAVYAALHQPGVIAVTLTSPTQDLAPGVGGAAWCDGVEVSCG